MKDFFRKVSLRLIAQDVCTYLLYLVLQQHIQPSRAGTGSLWTSNGVSRGYQNGGSNIDDDYMSDSSASSFARGARMRSSLPILKHINTKPVGE